MNDSKQCAECGTALATGTPEGLCPGCLLKRGFATQTSDGSAAARFTPPTPEELAQHFPQLEILELLGRGGMGAVYKARQKQLDRFVALKILSPGISHDPSFAERFAREARALAKLHHPNIVTLYEFGDPDGRFYFLMEFVDGVNLKQLLDVGRISAREALAIVPQICDALQFAHDQGIVHRDIKPENILLDRRGRVKVADFGIAKLMESGTDTTPANGIPLGSVDLTEAGKIMGTPKYMAPEQTTQPDSVDHRADIYALGVVFYQMLTGELPGKSIEAPSKKVHIDVRLDEIVMRALEKSPELRWQTAVDLRTQVETISAVPGGAREAHAPPQTPPRFSLAAIVGATWIPFFFGAVVFMAVERPTGFAGYTFTATMLVFLSLAGCFGTTILGWVAASQIHRSFGKLYGMWLAVFDGLFFPLLALDGFIGFAWGVIIGFPIQAPVPIQWKNPNGLGNLSWAVLIFLTAISSVLVDYFIIRAVWRRVNRTLPEPIETAPTATRQPGRFALVTVAGILLLGFLALAGFMKFAAPAKTHPTLAESPFELQKLSTAEVIQAGVSNPFLPWAWQELDRRPLTNADAGKILDGLTTWLERDYPEGFTKPLSWLDTFLNQLAKRGLVSDEKMIRFMEALEGNVRCEPLLRRREGVKTLYLRAGCRNQWARELFGLVMMNELHGVTVDGQPVALPRTGGGFWNTSDVQDDVPLPALAPGNHKIKLEVLSALVPKDDLTGLPSNAPSTDWPQGKKRWIRTAETELTIYSQDAEIVERTEAPALSPTVKGGLSVKQIIIRPKDTKSQAVVIFDITEKLRVNISFDVALRIGGQTIPCGALWTNRRPDGEISSTSGGELTTELASLTPEIKEADIILTPNPKHVESIATVGRIWGGEIILRHIPLTRQDVVNPASPLPTVAPASGKDFVVFHPAATGTAMLDAARDFIIERKWKLKGEGGNGGNVTIEAADAAGKWITFNERFQAEGTSRFTVSAEAGAEMSASEIGAWLSQRVNPVVLQPVPRMFIWMRIFLAMCVFGIAGIILFVVLVARKSTAGRAIFAGLAVVLGVAVAGIAIAIFWFRPATQVATPVPGRDAHSSSTPSESPVAERIGPDGRYTAMVHHDNAGLHYVIFYEGDFGSSGGCTFNTHSLKWLEDFNLTLKNGRTFGYQRESVYADFFLKINGRQFDFRNGRVFVLHDDGNVEQLDLSPSLTVARDLRSLARLVAGKQERATGAVSFGPVMEGVLPLGEPAGEPAGPQYYFQFRSGTAVADNASNWNSQEIDFRANLDADEETISLVGMRCVFTNDVRKDLKWEEFTAGEAVKMIKPAGIGFGTVGPLKKNLPATYLFKTAHGEIGLIQVLGIIDDARGFHGNGNKGRGMKFRYKLVRDSTRDTDPASRGIDQQEIAASVASKKTTTPAIELPAPVVTMLDIERHRMSGIEAWQPDGSPVADNIRGSLIRSDVHPAEQADHRPSYLVSLLVQNLPSENVVAAGWHASFGEGAYSPTLRTYEKRDDFGGRLYRISADFVKEQPVANIRFGVAVRPYRDLLAMQGPRLEIVEKAPPFDKQENLPKVSLESAVDPAGSRLGLAADRPIVRLRIKFPNGLRYSWEWRVVLIRNDVQKVFPNQFGGLSAGQDELVEEYDIANQSEISCIVLQGRSYEEDYHWTEFKGVPLKSKPATH